MPESLGMFSYIKKLIHYALKDKKFEIFKANYWDTALFNVYNVFVVCTFLFITKDVYANNIPFWTSFLWRSSVVFSYPLIFLSFKHNKRYMWMIDLLGIWIEIFCTFCMYHQVLPDLSCEGFICYFIAIFIVSMFAPRQAHFYGSYILLLVLLYATAEEHGGKLHYIVPVDRMIMVCGIMSFAFVFCNMCIQGISVRLYETQEKLKKAMCSDYLTGVYNRQVIESLTENGTLMRDCTIWMLDIDNFKEINDTNGHIYGDKALQKLARGLRDISRSETDIVVRYGGDEFVVVFNYSEVDQIERFNKLKSLIDGQFTVSVGSVTCKKTENIYTCMRRADEALYESKKTKNKLTIA